MSPDFAPTMVLRVLGITINVSAMRIRLRPASIWVELGKIIYYSYIGEYTPPKALFCGIPRYRNNFGKTPKQAHRASLKKFKENWDAL